MWHGNTSISCPTAVPTSATTSGSQDVARGAVRQVTQFDDFDITFPSIGPDAIVFQAGGRLYLLILRVGEGDGSADPRRDRRDDAAARGRRRPTSLVDRSVGVADGQARRLRGARRRLHRAGGVRRGRQRDAQSRASPIAIRAGRPTGRRVAYWSDRSGEYELTLRAGRRRPAAERKVTSLGPGFRYAPQWSPDSKKLAFIDQAMRIRIYDDATGKVTDVDQESRTGSRTAGSRPSACSGRPTRGGCLRAPDCARANSAIFLFDTKAREAAPGDHRLPERHAADIRSGGQVSLLRIGPGVRSGLRHASTTPGPTPTRRKLVAVPLRKDVKSPLAARNDAETPALDTDKKSRSKEQEAGRQAGRIEAAGAAPTSTSISTASRRAPSCCRPRPATTPTCRRSRASCSTAVRRAPARATRRAPIVYFDLEEREEKTILDDADGFEVTVRRQEAAGRAASSKFAIVDDQSRSRSSRSR